MLDKKIFMVIISLLGLNSVATAGDLSESSFNLVTIPVPVKQINNMDAKLDEILKRLDKLENKPAKSATTQTRKPTVTVSSSRDEEDDAFEEPKPKPKKKTTVKRSSPVRYYYQPAPPVFYGGGGFGGFGGGGGSCSGGG